MKALTSVLIVEPSEVIVEGLRLILNENGSYNVLSPLSDAQNLIERVTVVKPDVMIINPSLTTSKQMAQVAQSRPLMPVIALIYQYIDPTLLKSFHHSIDIRHSRSVIIATLKESQQLPSDKDEAYENPELSERELDVLALVAKGFSSKAIASKLNISIHTVNSHRKNITHKTGIRSVAGLAVYATLHNLT